MIQPHGNQNFLALYESDFDRRQTLLEESRNLPSLVLNSAAASNAVMLGGGYFSPLNGYMNISDALSVSKYMKTKNGLFWPIPILNLATNINGIERASRIALRDPNIQDNPVMAIMDVEDIENISSSDKDEIIKNIFGTLDHHHPGVKVFRNLGNFCISGSIRVLSHSYFSLNHKNTYKTAVQLREEINRLGWKKIIAFQTRNPMHLAHEELCRIAMDSLNADGMIIHIPLGRLKQDDIPAHIRNKCIQKMIDIYFASDSTILSGYGFDMFYAGPREALLHAIFRQNMGATHMIVGRDHAGVGSYYGPFDAQAVFDRLPNNSLKIQIFNADHTAYSRKLNRVVMMNKVNDHTLDDFIILSGNEMRKILKSGTVLPETITRPEVSRILIDYYRSL